VRDALMGEVDAGSAATNWAGVVGGADVDGDAGEKPRDLAMRIRRLAQVRAHGAPVVR
jgi:hypothetical protein